MLQAIALLSPSSCHTPRSSSSLVSQSESMGYWRQQTTLIQEPTQATSSFTHTHRACLSIHIPAGACWQNIYLYLDGIFVFNSHGDYIGEGCSVVLYVEWSSTGTQNVRGWLGLCFLMPGFTLTPLYLLPRCSYFSDRSYTVSSAIHLNY